MSKKIFTIFMVVFFAAIAVFHFTLNFNRRNEPPSKEWAKEVLISSGNVNSSPSLIRYKDNYIVVHSDGDKIKILSVDKMGKKISEKMFNANGQEALSTNVVTDGKELYIYWTTSENGKKTVNNIKLDDKFNILEESRIHNVDEIISIGESVIVFKYNDNKIAVSDLSTGKSYSVSADAAEFLSGARNKEGYIISFKQKDGNIKYFTIVNGEVSKVKSAGKLENVSSIVYITSTLIADDASGYMMMEYRNKGEFGGSKLIKFSLKEDDKFEIGDLKIDNSKVEVLDISPYYSGGAAKFLSRKEIPYDKKHYYENIVEYNLSSPGEFIPVSRSKELSLYSAGIEDTVIFCDIVQKDKLNVYMTSKNEEFKKIHNNTRAADIKLAFIDTVSGLLYSFAYILPYAALWVIPTLGIISVYSILEYKLTAKKKKIGFALVYLFYFLFKSLGVRYVSFMRFGRFIPEFMSFELSLIFSLVISSVCAIYAYKKYSDGLDGNVGAMSLTIPLIFDSILTLMLVVPFMV